MRDEHKAGRAIELLLEAPVLEAVLDEDALVSFTVVSDRQEQLVEGIQQRRSYGVYSSMCHAENQELLQEAHDCQMSVGKYCASKALMDLDQSLTLEDCQDMTMGEIHRRLRAGTEPDCTEAEADTPEQTPASPEASDCENTVWGQGSGQSQGNVHGQDNGHGQDNSQSNGYGQGNGQGNGHGNQHGR